jgi:hypothetical protein
MFIIQVWLKKYYGADSRVQTPKLSVPYTASHAQEMTSLVSETWKFKRTVIFFVESSSALFFCDFEQGPNCLAISIKIGTGVLCKIFQAFMSFAKITAVTVIAH